jgi:hypothetical protein
MNPIKNVFTAIKKHLQNDARLVPPRVQMLRQDICVKCESYNNPTKQCKICFCVIPLKVRMESETCPKGKW